MHLKELLDYFPPLAKFIAVKDKNPGIHGRGWQTKAVARDEAIAHFEQSKKTRGANGLGCMCGSGGLIFVDHDGSSVDDMIVELSGMPIDQALPPTLTIASGTPGHYQKIYYCSVVGSLKSTQKATGLKTYSETKGKEEDEQLDIRCSSGQSVIFGEHPSGRQYEVIDHSQIAPCPDWIIQFALKETSIERSEPRALLKQANGADLFYPQTDLDWANLYLPYIDPNPLDWYGWRDVVLALHSVGFSETEASAWSSRSYKHTDKGFQSVWRYIKGKPGPGIAYLGARAKEGGWESPFNQKDRDHHNQIYHLGDYAAKKSVIGDRPTSEDEKTQLSDALQALRDKQDKIPASEIQREIGELQARYRHINLDIAKTWEQMKLEKWGDDDLEISLEELKQLEEAKRYEENFDWTTIFPSKIGGRIQSFVDTLKCTPAIPFANLLGNVGIFTGSSIGVAKGNAEAVDLSAFFGNSDGTDIDYEGNQVEYPNLWISTAGYASTMKTSGSKPITKARQLMQEREDRRWAEIEKRYARLKQEWDELPDEQKKQQKGTASDPDEFLKGKAPRMLILKNDITPSARTGRIAEQPPRAGVGLIADEIGQIFGNLDAYAKGTNTRSFMLEWWNGPLSPTHGSDRKGEGIKTFNRQLISLCCNAQPKTSRLFIGGNDTKVDADGLGSRLDHVWAKFEPGYEDPKPNVNFKIFRDVLNLFWVLDTIPKDQHFILPLSDEATELVDRAMCKFARQVKSSADSNQALSAYLGKFGTKILRYIAVLQILDIADEFFDRIEKEGETISIELCERLKAISREGINASLARRAIKLGYYFYSSFRMLQVRLLSGETRKDIPLSDLQISILEYLEKRPGRTFTPRQLATGNNCFRVGNDRLRQVLADLGQQGKIEWRDGRAGAISISDGKNDGQMMANDGHFKKESKTCESVDRSHFSEKNDGQLMGNVKTSESVDRSHFSEKNDGHLKNDIFSETNQSSDLIQEKKYLDQKPAIISSKKSPQTRSTRGFEDDHHFGHHVPIDQPADGLESGTETPTEMGDIDKKSPQTLSTRGFEDDHHFGHHVPIDQPADGLESGTETPIEMDDEEIVWVISEMMKCEFRDEIEETKALLYSAFPGSAAVISQRLTDEQRQYLLSLPSRESDRTEASPAVPDHTEAGTPEPPTLAAGDRLKRGK